MGNQFLDSIMKFAHTLPIFALAVSAAPTSNQQALENVASDLSAKGVDFLQNLADQYGVGVNVQSKFDEAKAAAEQYYNANKSAWESEFQTWMSNNGYDTQINKWSKPGLERGSAIVKSPGLRVFEGRKNPPFRGVDRRVLKIFDFSGGSKPIF